MRARNRHAIVACLSSLGALLMGACGGSETTSPAPVASRLAFTVPPNNTASGSVIAPAVRVAIVDASNNTVTTATGSVSLALGNAGGATLLGTTTVPAVDGIATFADLVILQPGSGYTLTATAGPLVGATSSPFNVSLRFSSISTGIRNTCGLTAAGAAWCWGQGQDGVLGNGTLTDRSIPVPVTMPGGVHFTRLSVGADHACALAATGVAWCWGKNFYGQLGDATVADRATPGPVAGGVVFSAIEANIYHTCALAVSGAAWCWGDNNSGQLGDGTFAIRLSPVPVDGGLSFMALTAGGSHTCALTAAGAAWCWGSDLEGQLGDSSSGGAQLSPVPVRGGLSFASIAAGGGHTCGITATAAAWCWGHNPYGQVGDNSTTDRSVPTPVVGGLSFTAVALGYEHSCGIPSAGATRCWGWNGYGQLGDNSITDRWSPVQVSGGVNLVSVDPGGQHTCGLTSAGAAWCWGINQYGQLGDGTTTDRLAPVAVTP